MVENEHKNARISAIGVAVIAGLLVITLEGASQLVVGTFAVAALIAAFMPDHILTAWERMSSIRLRNPFYLAGGENPVNGGSSDKPSVRANRPSANRFLPPDVDPVPAPLVSDALRHVLERTGDLAFNEVRRLLERAVQQNRQNGPMRSGTASDIQHHVINSAVRAGRDLRSTLTGGSRGDEDQRAFGTYYRMYSRMILWTYILMDMLDVEFDGEQRFSNLIRLDHEFQAMVAALIGTREYDVLAWELARSLKGQISYGGHLRYDFFDQLGVQSC